MTKHEKPEEKKPEESQRTDVAVYDPGQDAGAGMENLGSDECSIPFLYVLDAKSPQCNPVNQGGMEGARAGSIYNTGTNELYDGQTGVGFIPVHRDHHYGEWIPRTPDGSGGGFVGIRAVDDPLVLRLLAEQGQFKKLKTTNNTELVETFYLYGLTVVEGMANPGLVPFKSTGIKNYKQFMTRYNSIQYQGPQGLVRPPLWAHECRLGSAFQKKGTQSWYIPRVWLKSEPPLSARLKMTDPLYLQARDLYTMIKEGKAKVDHAKGGGAGREPGEDAEEIPM